MMNMTNSGGLVDGFNIFDSSTTSQLPQETFIDDLLVIQIQIRALISFFLISYNDVHYILCPISLFPILIYSDCNLQKSNQAQGERVWSAGNSFDHKAKTQPRGEDITLSLGIRSDEVQVEDTGLDLDLKL